MNKGKKYVPPDIVVVPSCMAMNSDILPLIPEETARKIIFREK